ncbi:PilW family protein [Thermoanaerobacterium thermosaccharolyticum]|uniref:PilW family protein n=1 Tax=Thermoanaerobacterium thermosaccharolyticum TaxID=1517 RepID=UPI001CE3B026|nr:prepilin-type N-terminal cleavage/methylation domain-containing protein [Thermoanaerobacterium thermosaccharolyticum]
MVVIKNNKGITLVELLVTLALLGIVISIYSSLYYSGYKSYKSTQDNIDIEQNVRYAMNYIINQIDKGPSSINIIDNGHGLVIDGNYIQLDTKNNKIYLDQNQGHEIATNIVEFNVRLKNDKILNIEIVGQNSNGTGRFSLTTDIFPRKSVINVK